MKKILVMLMLVLGLTFIYNPQKNTGYVYYNNEQYNYIILCDPTINTMTSYRASPVQTWSLDQGLESWIKDKIDKGMPFTSTIVPFRQQQQQDYKQYYEKRVP